MLKGFLRIYRLAVALLLAFSLAMGLVSCDKIINSLNDGGSTDSGSESYTSESTGSTENKVNGDKTQSGEADNKETNNKETNTNNENNDAESDNKETDNKEPDSKEPDDKAPDNNTSDNNTSDKDEDDNTEGDDGSGDSESSKPDFEGVSVSAEIVNKNGAKGVLTLTSDDGDQRTSDFFYTVIAPKYDSFKITVAIPTAKIADIALASDGKSYRINNGKYSFSVARDNVYKSTISGSPFKSGSYATLSDFWLKVTDTGVIELASHSHTHGPWPDTDELVLSGNSVVWPAGSVTKEIRASAQYLRNKLKQETPFIFRPGGSFMTKEVSTYFKSAVAADSTYLGMRSSNGAAPFKADGDKSANSAKLNTVSKFKTVAGRMTIATILVRAYEAGFDSTGNAFATTSSSSKAAVKAAGISAWTQYVDYAMQYGQWASIGFHSVVSDSATASGYQVYDWQVKALMDYVQPLVDSGDLWLASFADAAKYYFEWSSAEVSAKNYGDEYIEVALTDKEEDERFDEALTVKLSIPDSWSSANLTTDGKTVALEIHTDADGSRFVYANIVPSDSVSVVRP